jgi:hypothetical protein
LRAIGAISTGFKVYWSLQKSKNLTSQKGNSDVTHANRANSKPAIVFSKFDKMSVKKFSKDPKIKVKFSIGRKYE